MYDLAVYLPGGAVSLLAIQAVAKRFDVANYDLVLPSDGASAVDQVIAGVVWLSASYLMGHLAAFVSSYLIEKFVHYSMGYPSDIWLEREQEVSRKGASAAKGYKEIIGSKSAEYPKYWVPWLIRFAQIPAIVQLYLVRWARPFGFYNPKLPDGLHDNMVSKFNKLHLDVEIALGSRWEKIVEHFIANNCERAYVRMYNYLVIYGVLRIFALIVLGYLWWIIIEDILCKFSIGFYFWHEISIAATLNYFVISTIYILIVMAFAKFNRRYFEETILAFLLGADAALDERSIS